MATPILAKTRLRAMVAADTFPKLEPEEVDALLEYGAIPDRFGRVPSDLEWEPTYNLIRAAHEGWKWKMGRVSDLANVRTGDLTHVDSALIQNCERMVKQYAKAINSSPLVRNSAYRGVGTFDEFADDIDEEE